MPRTPEEPQIHESVPGTRTAAVSRSVPPLPGPRPSPRPAPPRADRNRPGPGRPGSGRAGSPPAPSPTAEASGKAQIQLVAATDTTAVDIADETVDRLLDGGLAPNDVLLLTTGAEHPWAQHERSFGEEAYWRQLTDGEDVFCAHASASERVGSRSVVVLAVNGGTDAEVAAALPLAVAKAGRELVVCGDPERLRALL